MALMTVGLLAATFLIGSAYGRSCSESSLVSFVSGAGSCFALLGAVSACSAGFALARRRRAEATFQDSFWGFFVSSIVVLWCLLVMMGIILGLIALGARVMSWAS